MIVHRSSRRRAAAGSAVALATVLGLAGTTGGCSRSAPPGGGFAPPPLPIEVAEVESGRIVDEFTAVGSLEASEAITVVAEIDATVVAIPFAEGQAIPAGGLIAQLDQSELAAQVDRAAAVCDQQRATFARIRDVVDQGAGAPQDRDDAAAALRVAEADLALARARLAKTRVTAPFAGIAGVRRVSTGAFLRAGAPITDLARIDQLRVLFTAPERLLPQLRIGAEVRVTTSAYPDQVLSGTIDVLAPVLDASTRSARIVARLANRDNLLRPGMSADVAVVLDSRSEALTVPSEAVFVQNGQTLVYVVQADSTVAPQPITLGLRQADTVEVVAGLTAGAQVVRAGHQKLYPGARVLPIGGAGGGGRPGAETAGETQPAGPEERR